MSSYSNEAPDKKILVHRTFTVVETSNGPFEREVNVYSDSPPPSPTLIPLRHLIDFWFTMANLFRILCCGTAEMDEGDEKLPLQGEED
ncbi:hypothetical protein AK830_g12421 [Neonectria ditissima]|uniref:Uncharacterized protein n=1 Tax=Neonectria ditissima TaxID=78410 RepID=A0A0P7B3E7_9HYPO|nr:hypothetical protein AK830_g12421 [Neonectria ditissima]